jgi:hypothetical protein
MLVTQQPVDFGVTRTLGFDYFCEVIEQVTVGKSGEFSRALPMRENDVYLISIATVEVALRGHPSVTSQQHS